MEKGNMGHSDGSKIKFAFLKESVTFEYKFF